MNFLTENKIEQYADLLTRIEEIATASEQAGDSLKEVEKRLSDMALLIKNVTTYQKTNPLYEAYRKARNKEKYRAEHERDIILHEAAARSLKASGITKLPNLAAMQKEYEALQAQKEALYADYGKLKKKVREYDIIKQNIDSILQAECRTANSPLRLTPFFHQIISKPLEILRIYLHNRFIRFVLRTCNLLIFS